MSKLIDLEFIQKWVDISKEELMERLVKDAIGLQKEAEENQRLDIIKKRKADSRYSEMVPTFLGTFKYLNQYFSEEEIINACINHMGISDLSEEYYFRGIHTESRDNFLFVKTVRHHKFKEIKGSWEREVYDDASLFLVPNRYQGVRGSHEVTKELLLKKKSWLKDYDMNIYDVSFNNDWIYVEINEQPLFCPFSAIMENNPEAIYNCHKDYWHRYRRGEADKEVEEYLNSKEVLDFLEKVRNK